VYLIDSIEIEEDIIMIIITEMIDEVEVMEEEMTEDEGLGTKIPLPMTKRVLVPVR
jgi:hypothetical protein